MTLITRINILNLDLKTSSEKIYNFAGFPSDKPLARKEDGDYWFSVGSEHAWVNVTCSIDGYTPIIVLIKTDYSAEADAVHNGIVTKLIAHLQTIKKNVIVLAHNGYTDQWVVNAAPYYI